MIQLVPLAFLGTLWLRWVAEISLPWWGAALPFGLGLLALLLARRPVHVAAGLACLAVAVALLRSEEGAGAARPPSPLARLIGTRPPQVVRGVVVDEPVPRQRAQQARLRVDAVRLPDGEWQTTLGQLQLVTSVLPPLHYGDVLEVQGQLLTPEASSPGGYAAALRRQGIDGVVAFPRLQHLREAGDVPASHGALLALRRRLATIVESLLPEPQASLVTGMLLGRRVTIPHSLLDQLDRAGASHLIAISGYNVSLVVGLMMALAGHRAGQDGRRRWLVAAGASVALWAFVALVGASGSVLRAAAMAQLALVGGATGRTASAGGLLLWGSAFLAAWQPDLLTDLGWQLSFLGTAGLCWLATPLAVRLGRLPPLLRDGLAASLAAQLFVLPVLASTFGHVSLVGPLVNTLVLPLVPAIMLGGTAMVVAETFLPPLAPLMGALTWVPVTALIAVVQWAAALPWAAPGLPPWTPPISLAYFAALAVLCRYLHRLTPHDPRRLLPGQSSPLAVAPGPWTLIPADDPAYTRARAWPAVVLGALVALSGVAWAMAAPPAVGAQPRGSRLTLPDVADGTLALVSTPEGTKVLLNGGPATGSATDVLGELLRPWDRTVDAVVVADPRPAYVLGLGHVLERYRTGTLIDLAPQTLAQQPSQLAGSRSSPASSLAPYDHIRTTARRRGIPYLPIYGSSEIAVGPGLRLQVSDAAPSQARGASPAGPAGLRVGGGSFSLLLPCPGADASGAGWRALLSTSHPLQSTVLLLAAEHAQDPAMAAMVRAVSPELVVVQGDEGSRRRASPALPAGWDPADQAPPAPPGWGGYPRSPAWHYTASAGPLTLEVSAEGYHILKS
jgi:competence protein ComEC